MKLLVITADDLGYSEERNNGIEECFRRGIVTHSSLMVNGVAAEHGAKLYKDHGYSLGLHFNITEGLPVADVTKSSSLTNEMGEFMGPDFYCDDSQCAKIKKLDVRAELKAQLEKFRSLIGHYPGHVDGHQHVHITNGVCEVFAEVLKEYGVRSTRLPVDVTVGMWPVTRYGDSMPQVVHQSRCVQSVFQRHGIRTSDCYFGLTTMGCDMTIDKVKAGLLHAYSSVKTRTGNSQVETRADNSRLQTGADNRHVETMADNSKVETRADNSQLETRADNSKVETGANNVAISSGADNFVCEFMVHPGYRNGDIGGCGTGPDDFSQWEEREHEIRILSDRELLDYYAQNNIKLVPWAQCLN